MIAIDLTGRTALVTGGARGIGLEIGRTLREAGARVVLADVDAATAPDFDTDPEDGFASAALDVTDRDAATALMRRLRDRGWFPDLLINNAGAASRVGGIPFTRQPVEEWRRCFEINLLGTANVSAAWVAERAPETPGVIVNLASVVARAPARTDPAYSAAKAGVVNFTHELAGELAPHVRVCAVCPGIVDTPFQRAVYERTKAVDEQVADETPEEFFERRVRAFVPLQRGQTPRDVANAVAFLCSDLAGSITGQALHVDGGFVMV